MKISNYLMTCCLFFMGSLYGQETIQYEISFANAVHHEANISVNFTQIEADTLSVRMSRTSPGRYAVHEFAKNVYNLKAFDENGKELRITRPNPYQWDISGHRGTIKITYTLFANHGDGTYSQIDESHAHLNIPATFIYAPKLNNRKIELEVFPRDDLNWRAATQLKKLTDNRYYAPDLDYFMDSPIEISDHKIRSFSIDSQGKTYEINFVLHQADTYEGFETYAENVQKIVRSEMEIFGELPDFDFGAYTFLACYIENVDGDGMEHRNSTVLTDKKPLSKGGDKENIGTVAHEFFHAYNVERIRPLSLEPFDYTEANMSGELWFAEGFTSYYTNLTLCRTGILSREDYAAGLASLLDYVWNSPGRAYFNPIEMSYQAPFVDAATSVDQVNYENIFISYYSYGNALGLALDLSLRNLGPEKSLDGFMQLLWQHFGKNETPYTLKDLEEVLCNYTDTSFGKQFFNDFIYNSLMPDYATLFSSVGIVFEYAYADKPSWGAYLQPIDNKWVINSNPLEQSSLYNAGLSKGDQLVSIDGKLTNNKTKPVDFLEGYKAGDTVTVVFNRYGQQLKSDMIFEKDRAFKTALMEKLSKKVALRQNDWLNPKRK